MITKTKYGGALGGFVRTHAFKYPHTVVQSVGEYMGCGISPRHELAVIPDKTIAISHGHG